VVHNGVPINAVPKNEKMLAPDHAVGKTFEVPVVGTVALFRPRKGLEVLLEAIDLLHTEGLKVQLLAVGPFESTAYQEQVLGWVKQRGLEGAVRWAGFTQDVPRALATMDIFVLPSLFGEGLPMVILEAMATGLPVVATAVEGTPEAITHGVEGWLVPPGDPRALAQAIALLVRDRSLAQSMGAAAKRRQQIEFSDLRMAERLAQIYDRVLRRDCRS